jgi:hypothetical protein
MSFIYNAYSLAIIARTKRKSSEAAVQQLWQDIVEKQFRLRRMQPLEVQETSYISGLEDFDKEVDLILSSLDN